MTAPSHTRIIWLMLEYICYESNEMLETSKRVHLNLKRLIEDCEIDTRVWHNLNIYHSELASVLSNNYVNVVQISYVVNTTDTGNSQAIV